MARTKNPYGLQDKPWRFVQEFLVDLNASAAYKRAGYVAMGNAAEVNASRLLRNAKVAAAIQVEKVKLAEVVQLTQEKVLEEIQLLSHSTLEHYTIDDRGNVVLAPGAPKNAMRALSSLKKKITHMPGGISYETEIKLWNKPTSVRMAGDHLGTFQQQIQLPDIHVHVDAARERVSGRLSLLAKRHAETAQNGH